MKSIALAISALLLSSCAALEGNTSTEPTPQKEYQTGSNIPRKACVSSSTITPKTAGSSSANVVSSGGSKTSTE